MMKRLLERWRNRNLCSFAEMPAWLLIIIGGGAFLISGYTGLELSDVVPAWITMVNKIGYFDAIGTTIGLFLLLWGAAFWFFSCIAARCHGVLYDRWFK
ncbi:MAG: hypothetical protein AB1340_06000 [Pseudomonadota bacterium]